MPEAPPAKAPVQESKPENGAPSKLMKYEFRFEPGEDFSETALFVKGFVCGTVWISGNTPVVFRSMTGEDVDKINDTVKIKPDMTVAQFNTQITYWNLAFAVEKIGETKMDGSPEEKVKRFQAMAAPILARLQLAYLEFNAHIEELFKGKEVGDLAKKS